MFFKIYLASWSLACIIAIFLMFKLRHELDLFQKTYWNGLFQSWKLITFLIATAGLTLIAPYSGDWSWDYVDAIFMSVFTYTSAPWVLGTLFLAIKRKRNFATAYIAICLWMFSASWSYDLYILIRDGSYPMTWFANIFASSSLYIAAGFFWNLEYIKDRGVVFGFMEANWPSISSERKFKKVALYALLFMLIPTVIIVSFPYLQYY
jgi:hypothetical protein